MVGTNTVKTATTFPVQLSNAIKQLTINNFFSILDVPVQQHWALYWKVATAMAAISDIIIRIYRQSMKCTRITTYLKYAHIIYLLNSIHAKRSQITEKLEKTSLFLPTILNYKCCLHSVFGSWPLFQNYQSNFQQVKILNLDS